MGASKRTVGVESDSDSDFDDDDESTDNSAGASDSNEEAAAPNRTESAMETVENDEEEDELIKAIKQQHTAKNDHPPPISCEDVVNISFHPRQNLIAAGNVWGDVLVYRYTNEANTLVETMELHTESCRDIEFSLDGKILFSTSKDKSVMLSDVETGKLVRFVDDAHDEPVYCLRVLKEDVFATGDEDGTFKMWDVRLPNKKAVFSLRKNEDYVSDICTHEGQRYALYTSGDGSLTAIDMRTR